MNTYHKIQTVYKRDPATKYKTLLIGEYSIPEFEYLEDNEWVFTEKVDGTNIRIILFGGVLMFEGRTDNAQLHPSLIRRLDELFTKEKMEQVFDAPIVCLYGEGYGPKIQSGGKYCDHQDFVLFDVKIGDWWLQRQDVEDIAAKLEIDIVPIIGTGTLPEMVEIARGGFNSQWGDFMAEGIVARPSVELFARNRGRIITKIKHKDFPRD